VILDCEVKDLAAAFLIRLDSVRNNILCLTVLAVSGKHIRIAPAELQSDPLPHHAHTDNRVNERLSFGCKQVSCDFGVHIPVLG
jgi:hypothetical protein